MWSLGFVSWPPSLLGCGGRLISKQLQLHTKNHMWSISCPLYKGNDILYIHIYVIYVIYVLSSGTNSRKSGAQNSGNKTKNNDFSETVTATSLLSSPAFFVRRVSRLQACVENIWYRVFDRFWFDCIGARDISRERWSLQEHDHHESLLSYGGELRWRPCGCLRLHSD